MAARTWTKAREDARSAVDALPLDLAQLRGSLNRNTIGAEDFLLRAAKEVRRITELVDDLFTRHQPPLTTNYAIERRKHRSAKDELHARINAAVKAF